MIDLKLVRTIVVAGFAADEDPNATAPDDADTYHVPELNGRTEGHCLKFTFTDDEGVYQAGGTVDFTTWYHDKNASGGWASLAPEAAAPGNASYAARVVAQLFAQVTALSAPEDGTKLQIWAAPRTSL